MSTALLIELVKLAIKVPNLVKDIRAIAEQNGVTDAQWEDVAHIIASNPASYFPAAPISADLIGEGIDSVMSGDVVHAARTAPAANVTNLEYSQRLPLPHELEDGDVVYTSPNGALFLTVHRDHSEPIPVGFKVYGHMKRGSLVLGEPR